MARWSAMLSSKGSLGACTPRVVDIPTMRFTAHRVRWVPLYCFPTLSLGAFALYVAFLRSDYYAPFDCLQGLGAFGAGLPCLLSTLLVIPFRLSRVHYRGLSQDAVGGVLLGVPSALCGSSVVLGGKTGGPPGLQVNCWWPFISGVLLRAGKSFALTD